MELVVIVKENDKFVEAKPLGSLDQAYVIGQLVEGKKCEIELNPFQEAVASLKGKPKKAAAKAAPARKKRRKYKSPHEGKEAKILDRRVEGKFVLRGTEDKDFEVKHPSRGYLESYCKRFKIKLVK